MFSTLDLNQLRRDILSGQFDSLRSAAGSVTPVLETGYARRRIENDEGKQFTSFAGNSLLRIMALFYPPMRVKAICVDELAARLMMTYAGHYLKSNCGGRSASE